MDNTDSIKLKKEKLDSLYISETELKKGTTKVLHAEPLYIDLIRDLGARKGEKEWNVGIGMTDFNNFDAYTTLVEYEFAPINRLGFEVELPFTFYYPVTGNNLTTNQIPKSKLNSIKLATQYSFFVSDATNTSMAIGYIHEFEMNSFDAYKTNQLFIGNVFNPFFVAAKRWTDNFHTLLYTGPIIEKSFNSPAKTSWQINSNFHYMIKGARNFIGIELNKEINKQDFDMTLRPQMRVGVTENLLVGIVTGIPIKRETERFSSFLRLIYEPSHKSSKKQSQNYR